DVRLDDDPTGQELEAGGGDETANDRDLALPDVQAAQGSLQPGLADGLVADEPLPGPRHTPVDHETVGQSAPQVPHRDPVPPVADRGVDAVLDCADPYHPVHRRNPPDPVDCGCRDACGAVRVGHGDQPRACIVDPRQHALL